jgi:hypothetical protein
MKRLVWVVLLLLPIASEATGLDSDTENALNEVIEMLVTPKQRNQLIDKDAKSKKADEFALQVAGSDANKQKIYELAAKVMKDLAVHHKGDPEKMMEVLNKASKDPESFARSFSPEQRNALKDLALEIERTKGSRAVP